VSSREEEKQARRNERRQREEQAGSSASRRRLLQIAGGVLVACAIVIGLVLALSGGDGGVGGGDDTKLARPVPIPDETAAIPAAKQTDLAKAVTAAGCKLTDPPLEGSADPPLHVEGKVKYKSNPPTSGDHSAVWASDGNYVGASSPEPENFVHALEHGRILIQYRPTLPAAQVSQLLSVFKEPAKTDFGLEATDGGFALIFENNTKMPYAVAATAWGHLLGCDAFNDRIFDAIRAFRTKYTLQAPEQITQAE